MLSLLGPSYEMSSSVGPELPPHLLAKRKRKQEEEYAQQSAVVGSSTPVKSRSTSPESATKRRRVLGPAPPPAPLGQRPADPPTGGDASSSEDEYGPVMPSKAGPPPTALEQNQSWDAVRPSADQIEQGEMKSGRDEWMLIPPTQDDLAARMDPTKARARKFNTGKGAKGTGQAGTDNTMWTETPEQKRKRLRDQVLGVGETSAATEIESVVAARKRKEDGEKARKVREYDVSSARLAAGNISIDFMPGKVQRKVSG